MSIETVHPDDQPPRPLECRETILRPGTAAPEFDLPTGPAPGERLALRSFRGRPVVLAFYPADWSPVCGDQLVLYNEMMEMFAEYEAQVLGISVDGPWSHQAYARWRKLRFPLLSDFEPKGEVARRYGVYRAEGLSERALFVIDRQGVIRWSELSGFYVNPGAGGIFEALDRLRAEHRDEAGGTP